ncbi:hypothetical protein PHYBOEH_002089 [Phytophthora boehmeriae]|uniref:C2H2-type domain-containing protein n=1 Tax=Phytophthora boehmeriae TaxID=109152 RepID=A0A8T1X5N4_9STRA|nr:hypothetical protein PHYBOEH_002089 [Phytophthora boehmeriae]
MLIMHLDESETSPAASVNPALPALIKREVSPSHASSLAWRQETSSLNYQPNEAPLPLPERRPKKTKTDVFVCTEVHCGKQFPRSFALRRHMRIHTGTKPYACDYEGCSQRFNTSGNLSRHKRIHSGERPYPCIFASCGKRFNTSTKLKRHMRIHFPEGQNLFRCIDIPDCNWSCDNYKEFAQHQKMHHNIIVGAQQERQQDAAAVSIVNVSSSAKDNDYFSAADTTREYATEHLSYHQHHHPTPATGSFLYSNSYPPEKPKSSVLVPPTGSSGRNKLIGAPFFGPTDLGSSLPTMLPKDHTKRVSDMDHGYGSDHRRMKPGGAFPSAQYATSGGSFSLSSDSTFSRTGGYSTNSSHFATLRPEEDRGDGGYEQHSQQHLQLPPPGHHVLRPPPQNHEDGKYGGFTVPPPMNPAAPEFTGEELNVVLQLMNENDNY